MKYPSLKIIGLMSGTSLDGLDIAACTFSGNDGEWKYSVDAAETIEYESKTKDRLAALMQGNALDLTGMHFNLGYLFGDKVKDFLVKHNFKPDYISSHGHTVFHQPHNGISLQIGHGACIAAKASVPVIYDFRVLDVALGGQGAPLVPIGDKLLYSEYDFCLNLGGISNISFDNMAGKRVAYDISPVNIVLNALANKVGKEYDDKGDLASEGSFSSELYTDLENLSFYSSSGPKSLGREWIDGEIFPLVEKYNLSIADKLHTFCHHIASRISEVFRERKGKRKVLVTGGGAFNDFLIGLIRQKSDSQTEIIVPDKQTIMFKEAIVFAFLGYLRVLNINNCLSSVTGASRDNCGGVITGI